MIYLLNVVKNIILQIFYILSLFIREVSLPHHVVWCRNSRGESRSLLGLLHLGWRIIKIEMPPHRNYFNEQKAYTRTNKKNKIRKKSTVAYRERSTLVLAWKEKRVVTCLTNWNNAGMTSAKRILRGGVEVTVKKPNVNSNKLYQSNGRCRSCRSVCLNVLFLKKIAKMVA